MSELVSLTELKNIVAGVCVAVPIGVLGSFLVLRRMSLLGDAISHALLPGIIGAFVLTGTRDPIAMLCGALVIGLVTVGLSSCVKRYARVPEDASLGVVFSVLFALGVVMLSLVPRGLDFDPDCVLFGQLEFLAMDSVQVMGVSMPRAMLSIVPVGVLSLAFVIALYPRLKLVTFDPALAGALGVPVALYSGIMLTLTSATVVTGFQSVGSVLVVALLAAPGATAQLLTDRLSRMLVLSGCFAASSAVIGCVLAIQLNVSNAGMIAVVAGGQFAIAIVFAPRQGLVSRTLARVRLAARIAREDLLATLYRAWELRQGRRSDLPDVSIAGLPSARGSLAAWQLRRASLIENDPASTLALRLTDAGLTEARELVRRHRLWETYLSSNLGLPPDHLHEPSHRLEHFAVPDVVPARDEAGRATDPHGREIPAPRA